MKTKISIALLFLSLMGWGQNDSISKLLTKNRAVKDCEIITLNAVDLISRHLKNDEFIKITQIISVWEEECGSSEIAKRIEIIKAISLQKPTVKLIEEYVKHKHTYKLIDRIEAAQQENFGFIYTNNKFYFDYVPLNHIIDSSIQSKASIALLSDALNYDERLLCTLFSGNVNDYKLELEKNNKEDTSIIERERAYSYQNYRRKNFAISVYSGIYKPFGKSNVFGSDLMIGFSVSTPVENKLLLELAVHLRLNKNDKNFEYEAFDKVYNVNSETSIYGGGFAGYKLFDNEKYLVFSKVGVGIETVDTGLKQKYEHKDDVLYDVETIHFSTSISVMRPIFKLNYIGLELTYHYVPYQLEKRLLTEFNTSSISAQLFFRL